MAIRWGTPRTDSTNGFRVGYEFIQSPSSIKHTTGTVKVTVRLYVGSRYPINDSTNTFSWSGSFGSGSQSVYLNHPSGSRWSSSNVTLVKTLSRTFSAGSSVVSSIAATQSGINVVSGSASVSGSHTTPAKPADPTQPPGAPSSLIVDRVSDTRHVLAWALNTSQPVTRIEIQRWSSRDGDYTEISRRSGTAREHTDSGTRANRRYRYRLGAFNDAGGSGWSYTDYISTSPPTPGRFRAVSDGDSAANLVWTMGSSDVLTGFEVLHKVDGGNWGDNPTIELPASARSYTWSDIAGGSTHEFAIRAVAATNDPIVKSDYAYSTPITAPAPPSAPSNLSPDGEGFDATDSVRFSWDHNPVDGSGQNRFDLRYRAVGTTEWTVVSDPFVTQYHDFPAGTFQNETNYEWQVMTWGEYPTSGPWSDVATFSASARPTIQLEPIPSDLFGITSKIVARWTYSDPAGNPQQSVYIELLDSAGEQIGEKTLNTSAKFNVLDTEGEDGQTYTLRVRVKDSAQVWSNWAVKTFTVNYAAPGKPSLEATFDVNEGTASINLTASTSGLVLAESSKVYRQTGDGQWRLIASEVSPNGTAVDPLPVFGHNARNIYIVESVAASGKSSLSGAVEMFANPKGCDQWFWLNAGPNFATKARFRGNPAVSISRGRERSMRRYIGRNYAVEYLSNQRTHDLSVSGTLEENQPYSTEEDFVEVNFAGAPVCYRDVKGRRLFCSISEINFDELYFEKYMDVSFALSRVDYVDGDPIDLTYGQDLEEKPAGSNMYSIEDLTSLPGARLRETFDGSNLYILEHDEDARAIFTEQGENLYEFVQWNYDPEDRL